MLDVRVKQGLNCQPNTIMLFALYDFQNLGWTENHVGAVWLAYRIKWEALANIHVRKQFASSMATKFQQLTEISEDIEMEWLLFQTAIISLAVESL